MEKAKTLSSNVQENNVQEIVERTPWLFVQPVAATALTEFARENTVPRLCSELPGHSIREGR